MSAAPASPAAHPSSSGVPAREEVVIDRANLCVGFAPASCHERDPSPKAEIHFEWLLKLRGGATALPSS